MMGCWLPVLMNSESFSLGIEHGNCYRLRTVLLNHSPKSFDRIFHPPLHGVGGALAANRQGLLLDRREGSLVAGSPVNFTTEDIRVFPPK